MTDYNDGGWHKIPDTRPESVHPQSEIEMVWTVVNGAGSRRVSDVRHAEAFSWGSDSLGVINDSFRVVKVFAPQEGPKQ